MLDAEGITNIYDDYVQVYGKTWSSKRMNLAVVANKCAVRSMYKWTARRDGASGWMVAVVTNSGYDTTN